MKVLFFPFFKNNPYQVSLSDCLADKGVDIDLSSNNTLEELSELCVDKDILHIHWTHPYFVGETFGASMWLAVRFFYLILRAKLSGTKLVWTIHNLGRHEKKFQMFEMYMHMLLARIADALIVHSDYAKKKVINMFKLDRIEKKIRVIPHGHYIDSYVNDMSSKEARSELGVSLSKKIVLFCGLIRSYKGIPELITAFDKISDGSQLLILAGRPYDEQVNAEINNLVSGRTDVLLFPSFVPSEKMQIYMNSADVVVFPFRDIFTSGSVLLAMSFAKAIVVPRLESLRELLTSGGVASYDPEKDDGLATTLKKVLYDDLEAMGHRNFEYAQQFSWESVANDTFCVYESSLNGCS